MIARRQRLDAELVRRQLAADKDAARILIESQKVQVNGAFAAKPASLVDPGDSVEVLGERPRFVGRGGEKLAAALDEFGLDPRDRRCLDVGASTGGFTDCLLQRGAAHVVAVDVGHGQLHESLSHNTRVTNIERSNVRYLDSDQIGGSVQMAVADLSFISLRIVLRPIVAMCLEFADLVVLVKPQFESRREEAARGSGIITDPSIWRRVLGEVADEAGSVGAPLRHAMVSPIRGRGGNVEFLYHLVVAGTNGAVDLDALAGSANRAHAHGGEQ